MSLATRLRYAAPPVASSIITDTFTRADSSSSLGTADTGQSWTTRFSSTWGITSNRGYLVTGGAGGEGRVKINPAVADYSVAVDVVVVSTTGLNTGPMARQNDSGGDDTFYWLRILAGSGMQMYKRVGGSYTQLGSSYSFTPTTTTYNLKLVVSGTSISGYLDGVLRVGPVTDAAIASGQAGLISVAASGNVRFDNFIVT